VTKLKGTRCGDKVGRQSVETRCIVAVQYSGY
jgi:hypothetical protein